MLTALLLGPALSGCLAAEDAAPAHAPLTLDAPAGPLLGAASGLPTNPPTRSLEAPPTLALGEWWTYHVNAYGEESTVTLVVAGEDAEDYLVGMPPEDWPFAPFINHYPGVGEVSKADLAYPAHGNRLKFLDFPLTEGHGWDTQYYLDEPMIVEVLSAGSGVARLQSDIAGRGTATYSYNATLGAIEAYALVEEGVTDIAFELQDHGFGYEGAVRVPYNLEQAFCHGGNAMLFRTAGPKCEGAPPGPPQGEVAIDGRPTRATIMLTAGAWDWPHEATPAYARLRVTTPTGEALTLEAVGSASESQYHHVPDPVGTWTYEVVTAGFSSALLEGAVYEELDVVLPGEGPGGGAAT